MQTEVMVKGLQIDRCMAGPSEGGVSKRPDLLEFYTPGREVWSRVAKLCSNAQRNIKMRLSLHSSLQNEQETSEKLAHPPLWLQRVFSLRLLAIRVDWLLNQPLFCPSSQAASQEHSPRCPGAPKILPTCSPKVKLPPCLPEMMELWKG